MQILTKDVVIPETVTQKKVYVADDGKEFASEKACLDYETIQRRENSAVWKSRIPDFEEYHSGRKAELYYISDENEYSFLLKILNVSFNNFAIGIRHTFQKYGAGWYIYWSEDGYDYTAEYLLKLDQYVTDIENGYNKWKDKLHRKFQWKEKSTKCQTAIP